MKIKLLDLTVRELVDGYEDDGHDGVRGYGGALDIRPPIPAWGILEARYNYGSIVIC